MSGPDGDDRPKGEPVKPVWQGDPSEGTPSTGGPTPLEYQSRQAQREAAKQLKSGSSIGFGVLGFFGAIGWGVLTIFLVAGGTMRGQEVTVVSIMAGIALLGALLLQMGVGWRGFFPGFLIGVGVLFLCPIVTIAIICGGGGGGHRL